jgi:colicin import membrane protein
MMNGGGHSVSHPTIPTPAVDRPMPIIAIDMPVLFEDEGYEEMGESLPHSTTEAIIRFGLMAHLRGRPDLVVLSDMNLHYHPLKREPYVSPDVMVVRPDRPLSEDLSSYRVGTDGPMPILTVEVLSRRTYQQGDLHDKADVYRQNGVAEYVLIDVTGRYLKERLQLWQLQPDETWKVCQDADGGVTSDLGFRVRIAPDRRPRVSDSRTGKAYPRPEEAADVADARDEAERRAAEEAEARAAAEGRAAEEAQARAAAEERAEREAAAREAAEAELAKLRELLARRDGPSTNP